MRDSHPASLLSLRLPSRLISCSGHPIERMSTVSGIESGKCSSASGESSAPPPRSPLACSLQSILWSCRISRPTQRPGRHCGFGIQTARVGNSISKSLFNFGTLLSQSPIESLVNRRSLNRFHVSVHANQANPPSVLMYNLCTQNCTINDATWTGRNNNGPDQVHRSDFNFGSKSPSSDSCRACSTRISIGY